MYLSPSFRGMVLSLVLALGMPLFSEAQGRYSVGGGENAIVGSLPGDQVHPHLSISGWGGPRSLVTRTGRDGKQVSYETRFPALAS